VPTVVFMVLVPRFMALYQSAAVKLTWWENHAQQSAHEASLTVKTFSLSAVVAYLGLALSAFVYVPFGGDVMARVQTFLFKNADHPLAAGTHTAAHGFATAASTVLNTTTNVTGAAKDGTAPGDRTLFEADALSARARLNPSRLQDQMFAITVGSTTCKQERVLSAFSGHEPGHQHLPRGWPSVCDARVRARIEHGEKARGHGDGRGRR
jgi:anoctamin-10